MRPRGGQSLPSLSLKKLLGALSRPVVGHPKDSKVVEEGLWKPG